MPTPQQHTRVNLAELKAQIRKKVGAQRTEKYFGHLSKLFSQKLTKVEFDKLCYLTIGKENIGLHNQLIRSILKNAYQSDVPEPLRVPSKSIKGAWGKPNSSLIGNGDFLPSSNKSNGDPFSRSPRKARSRVPDRKVHDKPSTTTLPSHVNSHRADSSAPQGVRVDLSGSNSKRASSVKTRTLPSVTKALENGHLKTHDPRKARSRVPDRKVHDKPSTTTLPPHVNSHRADSSAPQGVRVDLSGSNSKRASSVKTRPSVTKALENGHLKTHDPRKAQSRVPDRKVHDKPSTTTLPPHVNSHRADSSAPQGVRVDLSGSNSKRASSVKTRTLPSVTKALENGHLKTHDLSKPLQLSPASSTAELPEAEDLPQSKRPRLENVALALPEQVSGNVKVGIGVVDVGNEEVVKELDISIDNRLSTPLGITFRSGSIGSTRRSPCSSLPSYYQSAKEQGCIANSELPATESLRRWMEQVAESNGLQSASEVSANLLNHGLEVGIGVVDVGNEEVVKELDISIDNRLSAPLGITFRSGSIGSTRRSPCNSLPSYYQSAKEQGCIDNSELPATESLRRWMEQVAESNGLQGASEDSANLLNHGLDAFLKRLIKSCIDLKGRPGQESEVHCTQIPCALSQELVSVKVGNPQRMPNARNATEAHIVSSRLPFSFLDFKTAMELYPQQLGGHWPLWLENICFRTP